MRSSNKTDESGMRALDMIMLLAAGGMITSFVMFVIYQCCRKGSPLRRLRDEFNKGVPLFLDDEPSNMDAGLQLAAPEPWPAPSNTKWIQVVRGVTPRWLLILVWKVMVFIYHLDFDFGRLLLLAFHSYNRFFIFTSIFYFQHVCPAIHDKFEFRVWSSFFFDQPSFCSTHQALVALTHQNDNIIVKTLPRTWIA